MIHATFSIQGNNLIEDFKTVLTSHHKRHKTVRYDFETGTVFILEQYTWSNVSYSITLILDEKSPNTSNEFIEVQCYVTGLHGRFYFDLFDYEKKCVWKFKDRIINHAEELGFNWTIEDMNFL